MRRDFSSAFWKFVAETVLRFEGFGYSRYDGATVCQFSSLATGEQLQWWWFDADADDAWREHFEEVAAERP